VWDIHMGLELDGPKDVLLMNNDFDLESTDDLMRFDFQRRKTERTLSSSIQSDLVKFRSFLTVEITSRRVLVFSSTYISL
jgi:hypothetical protein